MKQPEHVTNLLWAANSSRVLSLIGCCNCRSKTETYVRPNGNAKIVNMIIHQYQYK